MQCIRVSFLDPCLLYIKHDTSIIIESYEYDKMPEILQNEMKKIYTWLEYNGLVIDTDKIHYMVFHRDKFKCINNDKKN